MVFKAKLDRKKESIYSVREFYLYKMDCFTFNTLPFLKTKWGDNGHELSVFL